MIVDPIIGEYATTVRRTSLYGVYEARNPVLSAMLSCFVPPTTSSASVWLFNAYISGYHDLQIAARPRSHSRHSCHSGFCASDPELQNRLLLRLSCRIGLQRCAFERTSSHGWKVRRHLDSVGAGLEALASLPRKGCSYRLFT